MGDLSGHQAPAHGIAPHRPPQPVLLLDTWQTANLASVKSRLPADVSSAQALGLQRTVGTQALGRMLGAQAGRRRPRLRRRSWVRAARPGPASEVAPEIDGWIAVMAAIDAEDRLRAALADGRLRDAESGTTSIGPHRSDLAVRHLDLDLPAAEGSTGQQKAVLVSIALAHARLVALSRGRAPLLLLDEIAAHLDAERRAALFDEVVALSVQCWMTGTDAELFAPLAGRAQILRVADGSIAAA